MRRILLASAAVAAVLLAPSPAHADLTKGDLKDVFEDMLEGIMAILEIIILAEEQTASVPQSPERLGPTEPIIGRSQYSYVVPGGLRAALPTLFPEQFQTYSPLEGVEYSTLRNLDRQDRAAEAMDLTGEVMARRAEVTTTLTGLQIMNRQPAEALGNLGAQQVGNEATLALAASVEELTRVSAEAAQVEADQRVAEQYGHFHFNQWKAEHAPEGWLGGATSVAPESYRLQY